MVNQRKGVYPISEIVEIVHRVVAEVRQLFQQFARARQVVTHLLSCSCELIAGLRRSGVVVVPLRGGAAVLEQLVERLAGVKRVVNSLRASQVRAAREHIVEERGHQQKHLRQEKVP